MNKTIELTPAEYAHFEVTLEGIIEEVTDLCEQLDWYVSALPERAETCLEILRGAK